MTARVACALFMEGVKRVAAMRWARRLVLDVAIHTEEVFVRWRCRFRLLGFGGPTQLGVINAFPIEAAHALARGPDRFGQIRNANASQQSDDAYDDHDFDEGESALLGGFHSFVLSVVLVVAG